MYKKHVFTLLLGLVHVLLLGHNLDMKALKQRTWNLRNQTQIKASFLLVKNDEVYLQQTDQVTLHYPMSAFADEDQVYIKSKAEAIARLNQPYEVSETSNTPSVPPLNGAKVGLVLLVLMGLWLLAYLNLSPSKLRYTTYLVLIGLAATGYSFTTNYLKRITSTSNPLSLDSAFAPFKPHVYTRWDNNYFYVESHGIPTTHDMMTGITGWQQQVPIPQCYIGNNAWSIPLNPVVAAVPVPVNPSHFSRGAIAVAVNGIAIFNPYTNTGVDAFLDGQLDNWGGHCGRADDYHYHTAPLHLYGTTTKTLPIAYALDGFAVYGAFEPDGSSMKTLDANHGHYGSNGVYHYHGSTSAPYMIGNMVGQITEDTTHQIIPQASANPIRPAGTPLKGAVITGCVPNGSNGYTLSYTLNAQTYQVAYSWTSNGVYTFNFISPGGTTTSTYNGFKPCVLPQGIGQEQLSMHDFILYPNPSRDEITFKFLGSFQIASIRNISIYSLDGKKMYESNRYQEKVNIADFPKRAYLVWVDTIKERYMQKLVIN